MGSRNGRECMLVAALTCSSRVVEWPPEVVSCQGCLALGEIGGNSCDARMCVGRREMSESLKTKSAAASMPVHVRNTIRTLAQCPQTAALRHMSRM